MSDPKNYWEKVTVEIIADLTLFADVTNDEINILFPELPIQTKPARTKLFLTVSSEDRKCNCY